MTLDRSHPADERLIALYFGDEAAGTDGRHVRQHLHGCEACTWRYAELTAPLERLRQDAASEADEVFTPERLDKQRAAILARLEGAALEQKVIPFPSAGRSRSVMGRPLARWRWMAAAAAASLLLGMVAGRMFLAEPSVQEPSVAAAIQAAPGPAAAEEMASELPAHEVDEIFLSEIDQAVHTQRIRALSTLDQLTPTMRPEAMIARARAIR